MAVRCLFEQLEQLPTALGPREDKTPTTGEARWVGGGKRCLSGIFWGLDSAPGGTGGREGVRAAPAAGRQPRITADPPTPISLASPRPRSGSMIIENMTVVTPQDICCACEHKQTNQQTTEKRKTPISKKKKKKKEL